MNDENNRVKTSLFALLAVAVFLAGAQSEADAAMDSAVPCPVVKLEWEFPFHSVHRECLQSPEDANNNILGG